MHRVILHPSLGLNTGTKQEPHNKLDSKRRLHVFFKERVRIFNLPLKVFVDAVQNLKIRTTKETDRPNEINFLEVVCLHEIFFMWLLFIFQKERKKCEQNWRETFIFSSCRCLSQFGKIAQKTMRLIDVRTEAVRKLEMISNLV